MTLKCHKNGKIHTEQPHKQTFKTKYALNTTQIHRHKKLFGVMNTLKQVYTFDIVSHSVNLLNI